MIRNQSYYRRLSPNRVAILHTSVEHALTDVPDALRDTMDLAVNARAVAKTLGELGHEVNCIDFGSDTAQLVVQLEACKPDIVFNLAEGPLNSYDKEPHAVALLELLRLPYTGNGPRALAICKDKALTKQILMANGLPTLPFRIYSSPPRARSNLSFPLVVKPLQEDGSMGIAEESIVSNPNQLRKRVAHVLDAHRQGVLVEEFVGGREFNVVVLGNGDESAPYRTLPPGEYVYHSESWRVCTFEAKWVESHPSYAAVEAQYPAKISQALAGRLERLALACARAFHLSGYAGIDFRLSAAGDPFILEINPNPDVGPDAGTLWTAKAAGLSYPELLEEILRYGLAKGAR